MVDAGEVAGYVGVFVVIALLLLGLARRSPEARQAQAPGGTCSSYPSCSFPLPLLRRGCLLDSSLSRAWVPLRVP